MGGGAMTRFFLTDPGAAAIGFAGTIGPGTSFSSPKAEVVVGTAAPEMERCAVAE